MLLYKHFYTGLLPWCRGLKRINYNSAIAPGGTRIGDSAKHPLHGVGLARDKAGAHTPAARFNLLSRKKCRKQNKRKKIKVKQGGKEMR